RALAGEVDWGSFHEAPEAQRAPFVRPGDRLVVGPYHGTIPRWRGVIYLADPGAPPLSGDRLDMDADAVLVDLAEQRCSVVYRSVFMLDGDDDLEGRVLHVGIEPDEEAAEETTDGALSALPDAARAP